MTALAVLEDVIGIAKILVFRVYDTTIGTCLPDRRSPVSPTLSAQEGELDNLLSEPTGGWDDDSLSIAPRSIRYGKEGLLASRPLPSNATGPMQRKNRDDDYNHDADARELGDVNVETVNGKGGWEPGVSLEELQREEEELAKMDPKVPEVEFGEFEGGQGQEDTRQA